MTCRTIEELAHAVALPRREDVVVRLGLLQHQVHRLGVVRGVAPVPLRIEVSEVELVLQTGLDPRERARDLPRDEGLPPPWTLVIEGDPVAAEHPVALAVADRGPERHRLRDAVRAAGTEWRRLGLRRR